MKDSTLCTTLRTLAATLAFAALVSVTATAGKPAKTARPSDDSPSGWISLFNGRDLEGWTIDLETDKAKPEDVFTVKDGVIATMGEGKPKGVVRTKKEFSNYEVSLQWRWPGKPGNAGLLLHCSTARHRSVWPKSIEVQLMHENAGDFWKIGEELEVEPERMPKGNDRRFVNLADGLEKPPGEWNTLRVVAKDNTLEVHVNGKLANKCWKTSVNSGALCLQSERANIEYRAIKLKKL